MPENVKQLHPHPPQAYHHHLGIHDHHIDCVCFLMISHQVWIVTAYTFEWPTWKDSHPHNMSTWYCMQPKWSMSEWPKWKHICQDIFNNHHVGFLCWHTMRSLNKVASKCTSVSHRLIVGWGDSLLVYLSTGKRKQRHYFFKGHRSYSNCGQHKYTNRSWIPAYLLSQRLAACTITPAPSPLAPVFDSNSYSILIDSCCTACMTNCIQDFCNNPKRSK